VIRARSVPLCHDLRAVQPAPESPCCTALQEEELMATLQRLDADACIAMSIDQLLDQFYARIGGLEDDELDEDERRTSLDTLYHVAGEIFERFDVGAVRRELVRTYIGTEPIRNADELDQGNLDDLKVALDAVACRQAARLLRDTLGSEGDG
jgi:hypothetical protein